MNINSSKMAKTGRKGVKESKFGKMFVETIVTFVQKAKPGDSIPIFGAYTEWWKDLNVLVDRSDVTVL